MFSLKIVSGSFQITSKVLLLLIEPHPFAYDVTSSNNALTGVKQRLPFTLELCVWPVHTRAFPLHSCACGPYTCAHFHCFRVVLVARTHARISIVWPRGWRFPMHPFLKKCILVEHSFVLSFVPALTVSHRLCTQISLWSTPVFRISLWSPFISPFLFCPWSP